MYGFTTTLAGTTFDQAVVKTLAALKAEGLAACSASGQTLSFPIVTRKRP